MQIVMLNNILKTYKKIIFTYEQISKNFNPDIHTAKLCWQVLKVAVIQLSKENNI